MNDRAKYFIGSAAGRDIFIHIVGLCQQIYACHGIDRHTSFILCSIDMRKYLVRK